MFLTDPPHHAAQRRARDLLALDEEHVAGEGALKAGEPGLGFIFLGRSDGADRRKHGPPHRWYPRRSVSVAWTMGSRASH